MNRRIVCQRTGAVALLSLPGCLNCDPGVGPNDTEPDDTDPNDSAADDTTTTDGSNTTTANDTATDSEPDVIDSDRVAESELTRTGECTEAGNATVTFDDTNPEATISGCVRGHNGCAEPVVDAVGDTDDGLRVVIGEADLSGPETFCTEALVERGYELNLRFASEFPSNIEVVHDDADGRVVVATADRP